MSDTSAQARAAADAILSFTVDLLVLTWSKAGETAYDAYK
jgi:hypothetical protein